MYERLVVRPIHPESKVPTYAHHDDSGMDLYAIEDVVIPSIYSNVFDMMTQWERGLSKEEVLALIEPSYKLIRLGISVEIPLEYELQIRSKSGLAIKSGLFVLNSPGTIDEGYIGELQVILANLGVFPAQITKGQKAAQAVLSSVDKAVIVMIDHQRGSGGFGSTGV